MKLENQFNNIISDRLQNAIDRETTKVEKNGEIILSFITYTGKWMLIYEKKGYYTELTYSENGSWITTAFYRNYENGNLTGLINIIEPL